MTEYSEPDKPRYVHRHLELYVPMQADQKFGIMLKLRETFKLLETDHIYWEFSIDHGPPTFYGLFAPNLRHQAGVTAEEDYSEFPLRNEQTGV